MPADTDFITTLNRSVTQCRRCPRLVEWRERVAHDKVKRFADQEYWGKPVPGFGDPAARLLIIGLAPGAHGANRTGRMFTGDRSGEWLYEALHKFGFANNATSISVEDGLALTDCYISAVARCAPPQNELLKEEIENCRPYLMQEILILTRVRVIVALGKLAYNQTVRSMSRNTGTNTSKRPKFGHGIATEIGDRVTLIASFHPSQQNTFTGKLTRPMFHSIFRKARRILRS